MHSLRRVIIVKRVYEMKKMCCVFNDIFRFYLLYKFFCSMSKIEAQPRLCIVNYELCICINPVPVISAGCSSPIIWRIEGATSARRPQATFASLLSVT